MFDYEKFHKILIISPRHDCLQSLPLKQCISSAITQSGRSSNGMLDDSLNILTRAIYIRFGKLVYTPHIPLFRKDTIYLPSAVSLLNIFTPCTGMHTTTTIKCRDICTAYMVRKWYDARDPKMVNGTEMHMIIRHRIGQNTDKIDSVRYGCRAV